MDLLDEKILAVIQRRVPLAPRPYEQIARDLGAGESGVASSLSAGEVIGRIQQLRQRKIIREISAIFDIVALGYRQSLVAMAVPDEKLETAGLLATEHPGVSHCYSRLGKYNLWLTLAVSPQSFFGLEKSAELLAKKCHAGKFLLLPMLKKYKLNVHFGSDPGPGTAAACPAASARPVEDFCCDKHIRVIRALQIDLPAQDDAFAPLAESAGVTVGHLLVQANQFLQNGVMRRYAAVLVHQNIGAAVNVLVTWQIDNSNADLAGKVAASQRQVSHCYIRPAGEDWPYNFYTMIHGRDKGHCLEAVEAIKTQAQLAEPALLWTVKEYKKKRVELFSPSERQWEEIRGTD